jgi:tellurite resistance protein TerC
VRSSAFVASIVETWREKDSHSARVKKTQAKKPIFAVDSIPAVLAVTRDPFVVFTSNVFAILGLRAMYFALAGILKLFRFLHYGLSAILVFIGVKMLLSQTPYAIETVQSLFVVLSLLIVSVAASLLIRRRDRLKG